MNEEKLTKQIYDALNGKYPDRRHTKITKYKPLGYLREKTPTEIADFDHHFERDSDRWGLKLNREELEAIILIPEEKGLVKVDRVYSPGIVYGFCTPKFTEKSLQALFEAYSMKFADKGEIYDKSWMTYPLSTLLPNEIKRFAQHKDNIIAGIKNSYFGKRNGYSENDAALENLSHKIRKMDINHATNQEFIKAFWQKIKKNPNGYVGTGAWSIIADYMMEKNPQMVIEFDRLRKGIAQYSLPQALWSIPVNQKAEDREIKRRGNVPPEIYAPILEIIDKTIKRT